MRLSVLMYLNPMTIKAKTTAILSVTIKSLNLELPAVPLISITDSNTTNSAAGRLNTPPSAGQAVHSTGMAYPMSDIMMLKYLLHEMEMATEATAYSSTRSQPMTQATSSPMVKYE